MPERSRASSGRRRARTAAACPERVSVELWEAADGHARGHPGAYRRGDGRPRATTALVHAYRGRRGRWLGALASEPGYRPRRALTHRAAWLLAALAALVVKAEDNGIAVEAAPSGRSRTPAYRALPSELIEQVPAARQPHRLVQGPSPRAIGAQGLQGLAVRPERGRGALRRRDRRDRLPADARGRGIRRCGPRWWSAPRRRPCERSRGSARLAGAERAQGLRRGARKLRAVGGRSWCRSAAKLARRTRPRSPRCAGRAAPRPGRGAFPARGRPGRPARRDDRAVRLRRPPGGHRARSVVARYLAPATSAPLRTR